MRSASKSLIPGRLERDFLLLLKDVDNQKDSYFKKVQRTVYGRSELPLSSRNPNEKDCKDNNDPGHLENFLCMNELVRGGS